MYWHYVTNNELRPTSRMCAGMASTADCSAGRDWVESGPREPYVPRYEPWYEPYEPLHEPYEPRHGLPHTALELLSDATQSVAHALMVDGGCGGLCVTTAVHGRRVITTVHGHGARRIRCETARTRICSARSFRWLVFVSDGSRPEEVPGPM